MSRLPGKRLRATVFCPLSNRILARVSTALFVAAVLALVPAIGVAQEANQNARVLPLPSPRQGLDFNLNWDADAYANVAGGARRGYATDSVVSGGMNLDTGVLGWWRGGSFALGLRAISSTHPSDYVGDLQAVSNLDAPNLRQVSELWYSQQSGQALVRGGIMDVNRFFDVTDAAGLFTNASFGITPTLTLDVPTATYPYPAWGLMTRLGSDTDNWRIGVFQGNPLARSSALHEGAMLIAERGWRNPAAGTHVALGAWYRQAPESAGGPTRDWGAYANLEHALPGHPDAVAFLQADVSPGRVNTVPAYLGAGVHFSTYRPW